MMMLLEVENLVKKFPLGKNGLFKSQRFVHAVSDVSFHVETGEVLGLVGESGCGKTTTGRAVLRLIEPTSGRIHFDNRNVLNLKERDLKQYRRNAQMIFQDPFASLNPRMTVGDIVTEPLYVHRIGTSTERTEMVVDVLKKVGLEPDYMKRFPHEFSGGQRQRIGIARVLTLNPKLIIADEPVSALDVSVQAQIINLLVRLQEEFKIACLFISHDLAVVEHISNRVAIMYLGRIVEIARSKDIYTNARHPYTRALLSAIPIPDPRGEMDRTLLRGDIPSPANPPSGCAFRTRCPLVKAICSEQLPDLIQISSEHYAACHLI